MLRPLEPGYFLFSRSSDLLSYDDSGRGRLDRDHLMERTREWLSLFPKNLTGRGQRWRTLPGARVLPAPEIRERWGPILVRRALACPPGCQKSIFHPKRVKAYFSPQGCQRSIFHIYWPLIIAVCGLPDHLKIKRGITISFCQQKN